MLARISIDGSEFACVTGWPGQGGHEATTVPRCGWAEVKNGKLLVLAALKFVFFLVMDKNHEYHQNMPTMLIAVLFFGTVIN
jgi:hypothetical protein